MKIPFRASTFFSFKNKMILAHSALDFFLCNAKQEINLTLPYVSIASPIQFLLSSMNGNQTQQKIPCERGTT